MLKLFCYVDESGQDTFAQPDRDKIFIVGVVTLTGDQDEFWRLCESYESASKKGIFKWSKAQHQTRMRFLRLIFADDRFEGALRYSIFHSITKKQFQEATILTIARAIKSTNVGEVKTRNPEIYVDGLSKENRRKWGAALKGQGISGHTMHGIPKDENHPLIRLADTIAGFVRDCVEINSEEFRTLELRGKESGTLIEVKQ